jgi:hypothetical protein
MAARIEAQTCAVAAHSGARLEMVPRESLVRHPEIFARVARPVTMPDQQR